MTSWFFLKVASFHSPLPSIRCCERPSIRSRSCPGRRCRQCRTYTSRRTVASDVSGGTLRGKRRIAHGGADGSLRHAVISNPASVIIGPHIAHHLSVLALRRGGDVAGGRTLGALRHTEISHPAISICSHVATDVPLSTL